MTEGSPTPNAKMDRIRDRLLEFLEWIRQEFTKLAHIGRIKYDTTSLQRERNNLYGEMGRKAYEMVRQDRLDPEALKALAERIDALSKKIDEARQAMETLVRPSKN